MRNAVSCLLLVCDPLQAGSLLRKAALVAGNGTLLLKSRCCRFLLPAVYRHLPCLQRSQILNQPTVSREAGLPPEPSLVPPSLLRALEDFVLSICYLFKVNSLVRAISVFH